LEEGAIAHYDQGTVLLRKIAHTTIRNCRKVWREAMAWRWKKQREEQLQSDTRELREKRKQDAKRRTLKNTVRGFKREILGVKCALRRQEYKSALTNAWRVVCSLSTIPVSSWRKTDRILVKQWGGWTLLELSKWWKRQDRWEKKLRRKTTQKRRAGNTKEEKRGGGGKESSQPRTSGERRTGTTQTVLSAWLRGGDGKKQVGKRRRDGEPDSRNSSSQVVEVGGWGMIGRRVRGAKDEEQQDVGVRTGKRRRKI
jgi:hypothetical protein